MKQSPSMDGFSENTSTTLEPMATPLIQLVGARDLGFSYRS